MPTAIPDLWPDEVTNVNTITPVAVLRYQAGLLRERTKNILEAVIETDTAGEFLEHRFVVIAPALDRYRHELFSVRHAPRSVYPVHVEAACFADGCEQYGDWPQADSQDGFLELIGTIFKSGDTKAAIQSLIAQSNDVEQSKN